MKWKLIFVSVISLMSISVIGCWPFAPPIPPPPPPPPPPMHLPMFEDHYMKITGSPYERGLAHMASQTSGHALPPVSSHHMSQPVFFPPISPISPIPAMSYSEPVSGQERFFQESSDFDIGNTQEFVGYSRRGPPIGAPMMKVRHMNYRYRKRMKTQRPIVEKAFSNDNEVKYQSVGQQPRRYNVIDNRESQKNIPNSVNDKIEESPKLTPKVTFDEEESNSRQNLSPNKSEKFDRKNDSKDLQENSSQNKDVQNLVNHPTDMPIEVTSYAVKSADGAVTQVTEMLYDVKDNPFKVSTSTPTSTTFWRPSSPLITLPATVTENPLTRSPYLNRPLSETETFSPISPQPINTAVTARFNDMTVNPMAQWTVPKAPLEPLPAVIQYASPPPPTMPPHRVSSVSPSDYYIRKTRKRFSTQRPTSTTSSTSESSARESKAGLSGAAIAGIVIGSMVSIMLLAGNCPSYDCRWTKFGFLSAFRHISVRDVQESVSKYNDSRDGPEKRGSAAKQWSTQLSQHNAQSKWTEMLFRMRSTE